MITKLVYCIKVAKMSNVTLSFFFIKLDSDEDENCDKMVGQKGLSKCLLWLESTGCRNGQIIQTMFDFVNGTISICTLPSLVWYMVFRDVFLPVFLVGYLTSMSDRDHKIMRSLCAVGCFVR